MATNSGVIDDGKTKATANYTVEKGGMSYSIITDDIKAEFDFLTNEMPNKLDEAMGYIDTAAGVGEGFLFSNGETVSNIEKAQTKLKEEINNLKTSLATLHHAFMVDIDNVNAELEYNFGWVLIGKCKGHCTRESIEDNS